MLATSPFTIELSHFVIFLLVLLSGAICFFVIWLKHAANEKKRLREEAEKLHTAVGNATMEFIRAVRKMVNDGDLPPSKNGVPFPYALDLLKWILDKTKISDEMGIVELINPPDGGDLAMAIAVDIDYALLALSVPGKSIREWAVWYRACEAQEDFCEKNRGQIKLEEEKYDVN